MSTDPQNKNPNFKPGGLVPPQRPLSPRQSAPIVQDPHRPDLSAAQDLFEAIKSAKEKGKESGTDPNITISSYSTQQSSSLRKIFLKPKVWVAVFGVWILFLVVKSWLDKPAADLKVVDKSEITNPAPQIKTTPQIQHTQTPRPTIPAIYSGAKTTPTVAPKIVKPTPPPPPPVQHEDLRDHMRDDDPPPNDFQVAPGSQINPNPNTGLNENAPSVNNFPTPALPGDEIENLEDGTRQTLPDESEPEY